MYNRSERGGQRSQASKSGHASSNRAQKSTHVRTWKKTGSTTTEGQGRGQKSDAYKKRTGSGARGSFARPYAQKNEGTGDRAEKSLGARTWKKSGSLPIDRERGRAGRIKKRGTMASVTGTEKYPFAKRRSDVIAKQSGQSQRSVRESRDVIQDLRTEERAYADRRPVRTSYDKRTSFKTSKPARFGGGKSVSQKNGRGGGRGGKRKKAIYDHKVFIKPATANNEETQQYVPKNHFVDFHLHPKIQKNIVDRGYETPTPIQDQAIPYAMTGRDVIGIANTGTGKTAAFLLPLLHKICLDPQQRVLILAPTRELALQIDEECQMFTKNMQIQTIVCIGGTSMQKQLRSARKSAQIIIGTPGRTKDLMQRNVLRLDLVNNVVLDEVDRMLDMGFINDITLLLSKISRERQSLFFSATMDEKIAALTLNYLKNPITVEISSRPTSENVQQDVVFVEQGEDKLDKLHTILQKKECYKTLVFSRTKMGAKRLAQKLYQRGHRADAIHGDMSQGQRQRALAAFRDDRLHILVATDVVARGIDIDGITHVINYDLPENYEDYIHRIGRTGRGSSIGNALTFFER